MSNELIWTIKKEGHNVVLKTRRKQDIDEKDRKIKIASFAVDVAMKRLSQKYCNKGFEVLFDIE